MYARRAKPSGSRAPRSTVAGGRRPGSGSPGLLTPEQVHLGRAPEVIEHRQNVLAAAYAARPDRFAGGPPRAAKLPVEVWINRALPVTAVDGAEPANGGKEGSLN